MNLFDYLTGHVADRDDDKRMLDEITGTNVKLQVSRPINIEHLRKLLDLWKEAKVVSKDIKADGNCCPAMDSFLAALDIEVEV